jgi:hypothetical protein
VEQTLSTAPQNTKSVIRPAKAVADLTQAEIPVNSGVKALLMELEALVPDLDLTSLAEGDGAAKAGRVLSAVNEAALRRALDELAQVLAKLEKEVTAQT